MSGYEILFDARQSGHGRSGDVVSVAVSTHDCADYLAECLNSLAEQTHPYLDLIVVDDASEDETCQTALGWLHERGERFGRSRFVRQRRKQGWSSARNLVFELAEGDAVFVLNGDSRIFPRTLSRLYETMADTGAAVTYSHLVYFGDEQGIGPAMEWSPSALVGGNGIDAMALVNRKAWALVGGYAPLERGWAHYDLWCKFVEAGLWGVLVPELLCAHRVHAGSARLAITEDERLGLVRQMLSAHPWLELRV